MRIYRHHLYEGGSQEYLKELNVSAHENTESEGMNHLFSIRRHSKAGRGGPAGKKEMVSGTSDSVLGNSSFDSARLPVL